MTDIEWTKNRVIKLIQLYQSYTFLWDAGHLEFRDRKKRDVAWRTIAAKVRQVSPIEAEKKIHALRGQFRREQKMIHAQKSLGKVYTPKWYGYRYLLFTLKSLQLRTAFKEDHESSKNNDESPENTTQNYILPWRESEKPSSCQSCKAANSRDEFSTYGEYVANELRKAENEHARLHMKNAINKILFDGLVGKYDKEHVMSPDSKFEED